MQGAAAEPSEAEQRNIFRKKVKNTVGLQTLDANVNSIEEILAVMKSDGGVIVLNMLSPEVVAGLSATSLCSLPVHFTCHLCSSLVWFIVSLSSLYLIIIIIYIYIYIIIIHHHPSSYRTVPLPQVCALSFVRLPTPSSQAGRPMTRRCCSSAD